MKRIWVILAMVLVVVAVVGAGAFTYLRSAKRSDSQANSATNIVLDVNRNATDETNNVAAAMKSYQLVLTGSSIKYPDYLQIVRESNTDPVDSLQNLSYEVKNADGKFWGYVAEYSIQRWLDGPAAGDGYVLDKSKRAELLSIFKQIYVERALSPINMQKLSSYSLEFMTYGSKDRIYIDYIESLDGKSRGVAMINTRGQDVGLEPGYVASLYNEDNNAVISVYSQLSGKEIDPANIQYRNAQPQNFAQIDEQVHTSFAALILNTPRSQLSFGSSMDAVDQMAKSWKF